MASGYVGGGTSGVPVGPTAAGVIRNAMSATLRTHIVQNSQTWYLGRRRRYRGRPAAATTSSLSGGGQVPGGRRRGGGGDDSEVHGGGEVGAWVGGSEVRFRLCPFCTVPGHLAVLRCTKPTLLRKRTKNRPAADPFCTRARCVSNLRPTRFGGYVRGRSKKQFQNKRHRALLEQPIALSELGRKSPPGLIETSPIGWFDLIQQPVKGPWWALERGRSCSMALSWKLVRGE